MKRKFKGCWGGEQIPLFNCGDGLSVVLLVPFGCTVGYYFPSLRLWALDRFSTTAEAYGFFGRGFYVMMFTFRILSKFGISQSQTHLMKGILQSLKVLLTLYILTLLSCKVNNAVDTKNVFEKALKTDSLSFYFPSILNDTVERGHSDYRDFEQKWYSSSLYSFKEPILYTKTDSITIYRLLWLRSFHKPVCFTFKEFTGNHFLNAKTLDRQPAFYPYIEGKGRDEKTGKEIFDTIQKADRFAIIDFDTIKVVTSGQWNEIEKYISNLEFWDRPVADPGNDSSHDGSNWILEGRSNDKYHFITRRNARGNLMDLVKYLIKLSDIPIKDDTIY